MQWIKLQKVIPLYISTHVQSTMGSMQQHQNNGMAYSILLSKPLIRLFSVISSLSAIECQICIFIRPDVISLDM